MRPSGPLACAVVLLLIGCGRDVPERLLPDAGGETRDAGFAVDAGPSVGAGVEVSCGAPVGPDCCSAGRRSGGASCVDGAWVCAPDDFCRCGGAPQPGSCSDACGSDAFVSPVCLDGAWRCPDGTIATDGCGPDVCWGLPGDCCIDPSCVSGRWACASVREDC